MSILSQTYDLGRLVDALGGGTAPANLTTGYTPGSIMSVRGLGMCTARVSIVIAGGGATKIYLRLMDYTDAAKPRLLQLTRMDTGITLGAHEFTASADLDFQWNLGKSVPVIAFEKKTDGAAIAGDTVTIDVNGAEAA